VTSELAGEEAVELLALRVVALSLCDPDAAEELAAALPSHSHQDQQVDVLELESREPVRYEHLRASAWEPCFTLFLLIVCSFTSCCFAH